jgi:hypothetical protein
MGWQDGCIGMAWGHSKDGNMARREGANRGDEDKAAHVG